MSLNAPLAEPPALDVRARRFVWGTRTYLMGIVNATPDSFSGDGRTDVASAVDVAIEQDRRGAHIVDIGAESTRPGHVPVDAPEELRRLLPVVRGVRERLPGAAISIDPSKANVFREAHRAGGDVLNSVWGLSDELIDVALECDAPVIVMHNKHAARYDGDVVDEVLRVLDAQAAHGVARGLRAGRIILDPGIGFGKTAAHNIAILRSLPRLVSLGFPTLIGTSRKSTFGALANKPPSQRAFATAATVALAAAAGVDMVRVHDVDEMRDVVAVADAIVRAGGHAGAARA